MISKRYAIFCSSELIGRVEKAQERLGIATRTALLSRLLDYLEFAEDKEEGDTATATFEKVFGDTRPMVLAGPSGSGKTTTAKALLKEFKGPAFVIDSSSEWPFSKIDYSRVSGIDWSKPARYACQVSKDTAVSQIEVNLVLRSLGLAAHRGELKGWAVLVEEAHRYETDSELRSLTLEARKLCRKLLLLTADSAPFEKLASVLSPLPH